MTIHQGLFGGGHAHPQLPRIAPACSARADPLKVPIPGQPTAHGWEAGGYQPRTTCRWRNSSVSSLGPQDQAAGGLQRPHFTQWLYRILSLHPPQPPTHQEHLITLGSLSQN